jgi:hypothetical protein
MGSENDDLKTEIAYIEKRIPTFALKDQHTYLAAQMTKYATLAQISDGHSKITANIELCQTMLTTFAKEHQQMKEMIRRFDEVISDKVNRHTATELQASIFHNGVV